MLSLLDDQLLQLALQEDLGFPFLDLTTQTLFGEKDFPSHAQVISKHPQSFVLCGLPVVNALLQKFPDTLQIKTKFKDGDSIQSGEIIFDLVGSTKTLFMIERTLLNFLQHLSAIASVTEKFVQQIKHTSLKILDTRKTTPGFRHLDKYAVFCGGGVNHRAGLYDAILIKDNHIDALGGISETLKQLPLHKQYPTIIEIRKLAELETVLEQGINKIDRVLLDNMNLAQLKNCVTICQNKISTEASGNINLNSIAAIAETGVDYASVGGLTHSVTQIDLSMRIV